MPDAVSSNLNAIDDLIPPQELLFDGASTCEEFCTVGEGFTRVFLLSRAHLQQHEHVLDLGSGNGQKARVLTRHLSPTGRYEGLDIMREGVEWCQKAYAKYPNFRFTHASDLYNSHYTPHGTITADKYVFPYAAASFDLVFCASLFTHLMPHETRNYLNEIGRVLKPGGRLVMTAFLLTEQSLSGIASDSVQFPFDFKFERDGYRIADEENPSYAVAIPEDAVRSFLAAKGLRVCEVTYGTWSGKKDLLGALQDCIISMKL